MDSDPNVNDPVVDGPIFPLKSSNESKDDSQFNKQTANFKKLGPKLFTTQKTLTSDNILESKDGIFSSDDKDWQD